MAMQYDVKSFHATASTLAYGDRTRLKGVVISPLRLQLSTRVWLN
jgi:hypothetical protein